MKKPDFVPHHYYHIYNRGVEKRSVFLDDRDYLRFIHDLFEFNDTAPAGKFSKGALLASQHSEVEPPNVARTREQIIRIHCFCLMPNHFHLLLEQTRDTGIITFMKKLGTGYAMYFNKKYNRVGPLFQGRFKAVHIKEESHLLHLPLYIHLNPLDLTLPEWRGDTSIKSRKAIRFLDAYRWSSHQDYNGEKNFPSVTNRIFLKELFHPLGYKAHLKSWLRKRDMDGISDVTLE